MIEFPEMLFYMTVGTSVIYGLMFIYDHYKPLEPTGIPEVDETYRQELSDLLDPTSFSE